MARLAASRGLRARFVERMESPLLETALESRGWLAVLPPDRLVRVTERPERSRLVLDGDRLWLETPEGRHDLSGERTSRLFVGELLRLLRGDLEGLRQRYALAFEAETPTGTGKAEWRLRLVPRSAEVRRRLEEITVIGDRHGLRELRMRAPDGGRQVTRLEAREEDRVFSDAEQRALFTRGSNP